MVKLGGIKKKLHLIDQLHAFGTTSAGLNNRRSFLNAKVEKGKCIDCVIGKRATIFA